MLKKWLFLAFFLMVFGIFHTSVAYAESVTLRILCWEGYAAPYVKGFQDLMQQKYNMDVQIEIEYVSSPDEFWQKSRAKKVDLISPAHNLLKSNKWRFAKSQVALPVDLKRIPNYQYVLPFLKYNHHVTENGKVYGIPYAMGPYGLAYNADKVEAPDSWGVLWKQNSKHNFTISRDYSDCNIYIAALILGAGYEYLYDYDRLMLRVDSKKLIQKVDQLVSNAASLWVGTVDYKDLEGLSYAATWGYGVVQANKYGGNWKMAQPKEGTTMWVDHWVMTYALKNKPLKKKLSEEWINYCLSPDVQISVIRNWGVSPVVSNINKYLTKEGLAVYRLCDDAYWRSLLLKGKQDERTQNAYRHIWNESVRRFEKN